MEINILTNVLSSVVGIERAAYVSVPITTGEHFLTWYSTIGQYLDSDVYSKRLRDEVISRNILNAKKFISQIKDNYSGVIIEPTTFDVPDWSQADYHKFWGAIIEKYINRVYFKDGWYLSRGCVYEFFQAIKKGIPVIDENFKSIELNKGLELINTTISRYKDLNVNTEFFEEIILNLQ